MSSSVRIREVNVMLTTWMNSASNNSSAPYIIIPPEEEFEVGALKFYTMF